VFVFVLCWVGLTEPTWAEVRRRTYLDFDDRPSHALDAAQSEFRFKLQHEDSGHTDDKIKQLLTLSSGLATIILAFVRDVRPRGLVVAVLAVLFACVYLCVSTLGVRRDAKPGLGDASQDEKALEAAWARDVAEATLLNERAHAFRVDRFRAAGRFLRLAFLLTPVLAWYTVPKRDTAAEQSAAATRQAAAFERQAAALERQAAALERVGRAADSLAGRSAGANDAGGAAHAGALGRPPSQGMGVRGERDGSATSGTSLGPTKGTAPARAAGNRTAIAPTRVRSGAPSRSHDPTSRLHAAFGGARGCARGRPFGTAVGSLSAGPKQLACREGASVRAPSLHADYSRPRG
jgi:hypothetical protein